LLLAAVFAKDSSGQEREVILGRTFDSRPGFYLHKWDPLQQRLILYRSFWSELSPAVRFFSMDGLICLTIAPLRDLTGYVRLSIWDVAAAPDGGAVLAATLQDAHNGLKNTILVYTNQGRLSQMWEVAPYEHHAIAVGPDGSVYAFGARDDVSSVGQAANNSSLLIHYSKDGTVLHEQLPLSVFEKDVEILAANASTGEHHLMFSAGSLVLYVATTQDLFIFDPQLHIRERVKMKPILGEVQKETHSEGAIVNKVSYDGSKIYAQVMLWSGVIAKPYIFSRLVAIDPSSRYWKFIGNNLFDKHPGSFLQVGSDGNVLVLSPEGNEMVRLDWFKL
jgi:hypothetical protein